MVRNQTDTAAELGFKPCPSFLSHPGRQRVLRRHRRRAFNREGGKVFSETAFGFVRLPSARLSALPEVPAKP